MASAVNPLSDLTSSADLAPLFQQIAKRADLNKDGNVSVVEFTQFLQSVLSASNAAATPTSRGVNAATAAGTKTVTSPTGAAWTFGAGAAFTDGSQLPPCMSGWDPSKWVNPAHLTPKYAIGRALANYPPTPAGLIAAMPALEAAMPGTTFLGKDKIDVPGIGVVDVGVAFGAGGGVSWGWMPIEPAA